VAALQGQRAQGLPPRLDQVEVGRVFGLEHEFPLRRSKARSWPQNSRNLANVGQNLRPQQIPSRPPQLQQPGPNPPESLPTRMGSGFYPGIAPTSTNSNRICRISFQTCRSPIGTLPCPNTGTAAGRRTIGAAAVVPICPRWLKGNLGRSIGSRADGGHHAGQETRTTRANT
jgi:hypothetical protein